MGGAAVLNSLQYLSNFIIYKIYLFAPQPINTRVIKNCTIPIYIFHGIYDNISEKINTEMELSEKIIYDLRSPKKIDLKKVEKINAYGDDIFIKFSRELNKLLF